MGWNHQLDLFWSSTFLVESWGNDREAVGDAIYGLKIHALVAIKELICESFFLVTMGDLKYSCMAYGIVTYGHV